MYLHFINQGGNKLFYIEHVKFILSLNFYNRTVYAFPEIVMFFKAEQLFCFFITGKFALHTSTQDYRIAYPLVLSENQGGVSFNKKGAPAVLLFYLNALIKKSIPRIHPVRH
jgi:hypothetical protein